MRTLNVEFHGDAVSVCADFEELTGDDDWGLEGVLASWILFKKLDRVRARVDGSPVKIPSAYEEGVY
jgi:hypothetical protein